MKCDICKEEWEINTLCPNCWMEAIRKQEEEMDYTCAVCGSNLVVKTTSEEGERIEALICPKCKVIFKPM